MLYSGKVQLGRRHGLEVWVGTVYRGDVLVAATTLMSEVYTQQWVARVCLTLTQMETKQ